MAEIIVHQELVKDPVNLLSLCPFGAIVLLDGRLAIHEGCRMCRLCVKNGPAGVFEYEEGRVRKIDVTRWTGITVFVEYENGRVHPVSLELLGKARELADAVGHPVYALFAGHDLQEKASELIAYGADKVFMYDFPELEHLLIEPYTNIIEDFSLRVMPSVILVGGTVFGRSLAPRAAARLRTGLTADCTSLAMEKTTDVSQIRPAFGGNIMAQIRTGGHRPQFATVRYKIFSIPAKNAGRTGEIVRCGLDAEKRISRVSIEKITGKPKVTGLEEAEVIIAAGKAFRKKQDLAMAEELAEALHAQIAGTRPVIEEGWLDPRRQIGLSGRTVSPKLLIALGISGSVQWIAGMKGSQQIIAVNRDPEAPVFKVAHYGIVGDIYEILPRLIGKIGRKGSGVYGL